VRFLVKAKTKRVKFTLRIPVNKKRRIKEKADYLGLSENGAILMAIDNYFK
jgi:hypothetical protein